MYTEGAPKYVIELKGTDPKALRKLAQELAMRVIKRIRELGGEGKIVKAR
jgi:translation initiation factor 2 alpha subunit (eIF-2alpha)